MTSRPTRPLPTLRRRLKMLLVMLAGSASIAYTNVTMMQSFLEHTRWHPGAALAMFAGLMIAFVWSFTAFVDDIDERLWGPRGRPRPVAPNRWMPRGPRPGLRKARLRPTGTQPRWT